MEGLFVLKHDTVKERVALNSIVVGLSSWMRRLACGKENDGSNFCKVNSYHCYNYNHKQAWVLLIVHRVGLDVKGVTLYEIKKDTNGWIANKFGLIDTGPV